MKIYTKTGDGGETSLYGGSRVGKDDARISAIGSVDEANSAVGLARSFCLDRHVDMILARIQSDLFVLGADLAAPLDNKTALRTSAEMAGGLEGLIDKTDAFLAPLKNPFGKTARLLPPCFQRKKRTHDHNRYDL